jgi:hypothetical protein
MEMRLAIGTRDARLTLTRCEEVLEDEVWQFDRPLPSQEVCKVVFGEAFDLMNAAVHGE